ncbi:MAG: phosphohydrolase, partial [Bacteroidota bacterium]
MGKTLDNVYTYQSLVYKGFIYLLSVFLIVFFFPKGGKFKYEFQKGKPWQYENLYAPIDFSIQKSEEELEVERQSIEEDRTLYYQFDSAVPIEVQSAFESSLSRSIQNGQLSPGDESKYKSVVQEAFNQIYAYGVFQELPVANAIFLIKNNEAMTVGSSSFLDLEAAKAQLVVLLQNAGIPSSSNLAQMPVGLLESNVFYDEALTQKVLEDELSTLSYTRGEVDQGSLIITRGEVVEGENLKVLNSLREEYESDLWRGNNYYFILFGYTVLVALVLVMLLLFLKKYRPSIFENNNKVTFILVNILVMVVATTLMVKHYEGYVYVVPLCILPLVLKNFFDARLGLFTHVLTVLILGFVVPNSFEYVFLQTIAGIVTILTASELYKRANL